MYMCIVVLRVMEDDTGQSQDLVLIIISWIFCPVSSSSPCPEYHVQFFPFQGEGISPGTWSTRALMGFSLSSGMWRNAPSACPSLAL